jgi:hypothetical protein
LAPLTLFFQNSENSGKNIPDENVQIALLVMYFYYLHPFLAVKNPQNRVFDYLDASFANVWGQN